MSQGQTGIPTEFVLDAREKWLIELMGKRSLTAEEAKMFVDRDSAYNKLKTTRDLIYAIPGILLAIAQLVQVVIDVLVR